MLKWTSCPGITYQVQRSSDLASWLAVGAPVVATGTETEWSEAAPPGATRLFYRLLEP